MKCITVTDVSLRNVRGMPTLIFYLHQCLLTNNVMNLEEQNLIYYFF